MKIKKLSKHAAALSSQILAVTSISIACDNILYNNDVKLLEYKNESKRHKLYVQRACKEQKMSQLFKTKDFTSKTYAYELSLLEKPKTFEQHLIDVNNIYDSIRDKSKVYVAIDKKDLKRALKWLASQYDKTSQLVGSIDGEFYFVVKKVTLNV